MNQEIIDIAPCVSWPALYSIGDTVRKIFDTYQRYLYFQFRHYSDQSKIFQNLYFTLSGLHLK